MVKLSMNYSYVSLCSLADLILEEHPKADCRRVCTGRSRGVGVSPGTAMGVFLWSLWAQEMSVTDSNNSNSRHYE